MARVRGLGADAAVEHFVVAEGAHELFVGAVAEGLGFVVDGESVFGGVVGSFFLEAAGEDFVGGPAVDGVGGDFDFEHPVGQVFAGALFREAGAASGSFERFEFAAAFVDGDGAGFGVEGGFGLGVLVFARDLAYPSRRRGGAR